MITRFTSFSKERRLKDLSEAVQHCTLCPRLYHRAKVFSEANGNIDSKILFVAEAPGRLGADRTGIPLFGDKTGDNFEVLLGNVGWKREDVFITNAILCNPRKENGNNGTPALEEIRNCVYYLEMTISLVQPEVVVSLGTVALNALALIAPHYANLREAVGRPINWNGRKLVPMYHPGPRALVHRSLIKQRADFMSLAKLVQPNKGIIQKDKGKGIKRELLVNNASATTFQQAIYVIVKSLGEITYFKLTKLLYLIDLTVLERFGHTLTGEIYLRQTEGPWPPALQKIIPFLDGYELHFNFKKQLPMVGPGPSPRFDLSLNDDLLDIVLDVIERYGHMGNAMIKTVVYRTAPMRYVLAQESRGRDMRNIPIIYKDKAVAELDKGR